MSTIINKSVQPIIERMIDCLISCSSIADWILETNFWDDQGVWKDASLWND